MEPTKPTNTRLRLVSLDDAAQIAEIYTPFCLATAISFETVPPDEETVRNRIGAVTQQYPWLVAVSADEKVLGYAYAGKHRERAAYRWSVDFTVYLAADAKRCGLGTRLYGALAVICRNLGYYRAFAGITLPNEASVRLHEKVGFRPVGVYQRVGFKLGKWHDVGWWSLDLRPEDDLPSEPRAISEIMGSAALEQMLG